MFQKSLLRNFLFSSMVLMSGMAWGQSIFTNPITGTDPGLINPYVTGQVVNSNITVSGIGYGSGIVGDNGNNIYNTRSWNTNALDVNDYFGFTITPNPGYKINFISFVYTSQVSNNGPTSFAFRSSVGLFAADIGTPTATGATIDLSGASFQNISSAITFRLYGWDAGNTPATFGINDFTFNAAIALPIELTSFQADAMDGRKAGLTFSTATERNNAYFSIERSPDGARFESIGQVTGAGNSNVRQDYTYTDEYPVKGVNFYRLKQVDFDGAFAYSPVVSVSFGQIGGLYLSPLPVLDQLTVTLEQAVAQNSQWQVYDFAGRLLQSGILEAESSDFQIPTNTLTEGAYVLRVVSGQTVLTRQFQKQ